MIQTRNVSPVRASRRSSIHWLKHCILLMVYLVTLSTISVIFTLYTAVGIVTIYSTMGIVAIYSTIGIVTLYTTNSTVKLYTTSTFLWQNFYCIGKIFVVANGQIFKTSGRTDCIHWLGFWMTYLVGWGR